MNSDTKEIIETFILSTVVVILAVCCLLSVKWGAPYQVLVIFSGLTGTALGALGMKISPTSAKSSGKEVAAKDPAPSPAPEEKVNGATAGKG
jgi:hypothetical protein